MSEITIGQIVEGRVTSVTPFGVFVALTAAPDYRALLHVSEMQMADDLQLPEEVFSPDELRDDFCIKQIDVGRKIVSLSLSEL